MRRIAGAGVRWAVAFAVMATLGLGKAPARAPAILSPAHRSGDRRGWELLDRRRRGAGDRRGARGAVRHRGRPSGEHLPRRHGRQRRPPHQSGRDHFDGCGQRHAGIAPGRSSSQATPTAANQRSLSADGFSETLSAATSGRARRGSGESRDLGGVPMIWLWLRRVRRSECVGVLRAGDVLVRRRAVVVCGGVCWPPCWWSLGSRGRCWERSRSPMVMPRSPDGH